jgi:hypothetical protein
MNKKASFIREHCRKLFQVGTNSSEGFLSKEIQVCSATGYGSS